MDRKEFLILESCLGRPMSKNSVLEELSMRRFADIHKETSSIALSREKNIFTEFVRRERNKKLNVVSVQRVMNRRFRDDCTYRGVVYKINRREPRTEPRGTP
jgi:hypothetical protein